MKQEQRLVAELYRYIAPFIDASKDVYVSLDGQAALLGVQANRFLDGTIPDLWFTLTGNTHSSHIEAKALSPKNKVLLMQSQLRAWCASGPGRHKPHFWVATSNAFDRFYIWEQSDFANILERSKNKQKTVSVSMPSKNRSFTSVVELALAVLQRAQQSAATVRDKISLPAEAQAN